MEFNLSTSNIITGPKCDFVAKGYGLGHTLFTEMKKKLDLTAQIDGMTGESETYSDFLLRCVRTAIKMKTMGISTNDVISICSLNSLDSAVPYIAGLFIGAKISCLDVTSNVRDTIYLLKQIEPTIIFFSDESVELIGNAIKEVAFSPILVKFGKEEGYVPFSEFLESSLEEEYFEPRKVDDLKETAVIIFSSGTTGMPKGICLNHETFLFQAYILADSGVNFERVLVFAPLYSITNPLMMFCTILHGTTRITYPKFDPTKILSLLNKYKITNCLMAPVYAVLINKMGFDGSENVSSFKQLLLGGTGMTLDQYKEIEFMLPHTRIVFGFAQTELAGTALYFRPNSPEDTSLMEKNPTSCGRPIQGFEFKVVDIETQQNVGPNQEGELRIKGEYMLNGYYKKDSTACWDEEGWLLTGDVAYYDEDFCFYIVDRLKEMLKCKGRAVAPATIEAVLNSHLAVKSAVVIGIPNKGDDHPMGVVVLNEGFEGVDPEDLKEFVNSQVLDFQCLRAGVKIVNQIPTTPSGKYKRRDIRDMVLKDTL